MALREGRKVAKWTLIQKIGSGSFGEVYKVRKDGEERAMKFTLEYITQRMEEHVMKALLLKSPQYFPSFFASSTADTLYHDYMWILMSLEGISLQEVFEKQPNACLKFDEMFAILYNVSKGLEVLHNAGFVHRDIKPANLLIGASKGKALVVLSDFGCATSLHEDGLRSEMELDPEYNFHSLPVHRGQEYIYLDDLFSIFYIVLLFRKEPGLRSLEHEERLRAKRLLEKSHRNLSDDNKFLGNLCQWLTRCPRRGPGNKPLIPNYQEFFKLITSNPYFDKSAQAHITFN